jgi:hypothetical protein
MFGSMLESIVRVYRRVYIAASIPSSGIRRVVENMLRRVLENDLGGISENILGVYLDAS